MLLRMAVCAFATIGAVSSAGCRGTETPPDQGTADEHSAIRRVATEYTQAIDSGDLAKYLSLLTEDMTANIPGQPVIRGHQAVTEFAGPLFEQFSMEETIAFDDLRVEGDSAMGRLSYTFSVTPKAGGLTSTEAGTATVHLRRGSDGLWRFSRWLQDSLPQ